MNWYLKKGDGEIYGPVDLETLQLWATDSRIAPDDQVSSDRKKWAATPELSDLGMEWMVQLRDGTEFGPMNILSVRDLVQDGSVSRRGTLVNARTGDKGAVSDMLVSALISLSGRMQSTIDTLSEQLLAAASAAQESAPIAEDNAAAATTAAADDGAVQRLEAEVRLLTEQRDRAAEEAERWKKLHEEGEGNASLREQELKARFSAGKSTEARMDVLKQEVEEAQKRFEEERAAGQQRESALKDQIRKLKTGAGRIQELEQQVEKWKSLYEHERDGASRARDRHAAKVDDGSDMVPRFRIQEIEKKLEQVQKSYQQLLRTMNRSRSPGAAGRNQPPPADNLRRWEVS